MLAFAHFAGQRLPFRRLQGVLAFAITGGLACNDILNGYLPSLADRFYSLLFQREARGRARPEPAARVLAGVDPEYAPDRNADTRIWSWLGGSDVNLPGFERRVLEKLEDPGIDDIRALRRLASFYEASPATPRWRKALKLLEECVRNNSHEPLVRVAIAALNRLHGHSTTDDEALISHQIEPAAFRDPARASLELVPTFLAR